MLRRLVPVVSALSLAAVACGAPEIVVRSQEAEGPAWFSVVVDPDGAAGTGLSLTTDTEGNPHMSYLAFPEEPPEGEEAPAPDPLAPTLPAVMHAHLVQEVWTRGPVADEQPLDETSATAIAVDADGVHHVAWTAGGQLLYSSNAEGEFAEEPEVVTPGPVVGVSIAADQKGAPWISFQTALDVAEGPASLIRVATRTDEDWKLQTAAEAGAPEDLAATAIAMTADGPLVAYGSEGQTVVAEQRGNRWFSETVDEQGGLGIDAAVDADGNPHLAYLDGTGAVRHAHSIGGSPWEISDVGSGATRSAPSIALDAEGVHHVAWQTAEGIAYAGNAGGDFAEEELPPSTAAGAYPSIAAGVDGEVFLAYHDQEDTELQMAVRTEDEPLLAVPAPEEPIGETLPTGPAPCQPEGTELTITAQNLTFDTDCLAAPAGEPFTIEFTNQDAGVPHNVAIYTDESAAEVLFQEAPFPGPDTVVYEPEAIEEEGNLFFRCDVHPTTMSGTFVVAPAGGGGG